MISIISVHKIVFEFLFNQIFEIFSTLREFKIVFVLSSSFIAFMEPSLTLTQFMNLRVIPWRLKIIVYADSRYIFIYYFKISI